MPLRQWQKIQKLPRPRPVKWLYRIVRTILVSLLSLAVGIPFLAYIATCIPAVNNAVKEHSATALSQLLGAELTIGHLKIESLSRLDIRDITLLTAPFDTAAAISRISAGIDLADLTLHRRITITDLQMMEPDINIWRDSTDAPLNIDPIIRRLKGDGSKPPAHFSMAIKTLAIRNGTLRLTSGNDSLRLDNFSADINAPVLGTDSLHIAIKRLQLTEHHGLTLNRLRGTLTLRGNRLSIDGLTLALPNTLLQLAPADIDLKGRRLGTIDILTGSHISLTDLPLPQWTRIFPTINISGHAELFTDSVNIDRLNVNAPGLLSLSAQGNMQALTIHSLQAEASDALLRQIPGIPHQIIDIAPAAVTLSGKWLKDGDATVNATVSSSAGDAAVECTLHRSQLQGHIATTGIDLRSLLPGRPIGQVAGDAHFTLSDGHGNAQLEAASIEWHGNKIGNITAAIGYDGDEYAATVTVSDPLAALSADINASHSPDFTALALEANIDSLFLRAISPSLPDIKLLGTINAALAGESPYVPSGNVHIDKFSATDLVSGKVFHEDRITLATDFLSPENTVTLDCATATVDVRGQISPQELPASVRTLCSHAFPQLISASTPETHNNFTATATLREGSPLLQFIGGNTRPLYDITVNASLSDSLRCATVDIDAPYIQNGHSLISATRLQGRLSSRPMLTATATMPNKLGPMTLNVNALGADGRVDATIGWKAESSKNYSGDISLTCRPLAGNGADIKVNASRIMLNDTLWTVSPGYVGIRKGPYIVGNLTLDGPGQQVAVRGVASSDSADVLSVDLDNIDLDYLFDTLNLGPSLIFGGTATGNVKGRALLSPSPMLHTEELRVKDFSYQHANFGDGTVRAGWDNDNLAITIGGDIHGTDGRRAKVDGMISLLSNTLQFDFDAHRAPASFIHAFVSQWADAVDGRVSGHARLFGTLKDVDLEGDVYADNFAMTIGYTGVTYHVTDSVHFRPGLLAIDHVRLTDPHGNEAWLDGRLDHRCFTDPYFRFDITGAKQLMVLDTHPDDQAQWGGTVYGNGTASIAGTPGRVEISADMQTAPGSEFTFELRNNARATAYDFLTFRSIDEMQRASRPTLLKPGSAELTREMQRRVALANPDEIPVDLGLKFRIGATPSTRIALVMDSASGDKITAYGNGHIDVNYENGSDELRIYGDYVIERGDYNFTLQDIIIKNFSLRQGSQVAFHGDPLDATLNVSAAYQLNASLTDLDESFLTDKEIQRTNVPVQAVLNLGGQLQSPDISFDLDFPTLTSDVKRKVKSIVSTDEMMNRQIIYLLALNRFYTPDYMAGTRGGNDLTSFASGTISSQLSSILGQLSDKISVAPSLRSEAGDFSDLELDVALSSTLLNNRLLLNGNFGYRDKALNNNQFIGDFDVEYLLTRQGNWRLKAYNHFNDRNLYTRNALTTQGLGILFKHDFDSPPKKTQRP